MLEQLRKLGYPAKFYLYVFLFIATVIGMKYVVETTLPEGGRPPYLFLIWNTFLAWIPVGLAVMLDLISVSTRIRTLKIIMLLGIGLLWLFFYPNAAYLLTDLLHPFHRYPLESDFWQENSFWNHLFTVLFTALLGLSLGNVSLASVHGLVRQSLGKFAGWAFAVIVLLLSSFGVYLGRFIRWNSWDILQDPLYVLKETLLYFTDLTNVMHAVSFCRWIFLITFFSYTAMYMFRTINDQIKNPQRDNGELAK